MLFSALRSKIAEKYCNGGVKRLSMFVKNMYLLCRSMHFIANRFFFLFFFICIYIHMYLTCTISEAKQTGMFYVVVLLKEIPFFLVSLSI